jgi:hypothetical protein
MPGGANSRGRVSFPRIAVAPRLLTPDERASGKGYGTLGVSEKQVRIGTKSVGPLFPLGRMPNPTTLRGRRPACR